MDAVGQAAVNVEFVVVSSEPEAAAAGLAGSPTFLIDGVDLLGNEAVPAGLSCRVFRTESGSLAGLPEVADLARALRKRVV